MTTNFADKLHHASEKNQSLLCVGLDPDLRLMPIEDVFEFNREIIDATSDLVCCYKPNLAFYEALGPRGLDSLRRTVQYVPEGIPVLGDVKRGDIGNTAHACAAALFDYYGFDAVTVNPYMGEDSVTPFLEYTDKGIFVVCRTSNPGSGDFQSLPITRANGEQQPLYMEVADRCNQWNSAGNVGLVVGATYPEELRKVREHCPELPILVPGIGAQGGDLSASVINGANQLGGGLIITSSRQILYAYRGNDDGRGAENTPLNSLSYQAYQSLYKNHFSMHAKKALAFDIAMDCTRQVPYNNKITHSPDPFDMSNVFWGYSYQEHYESQDEDFAQPARDAALSLRDHINEFRSATNDFWPEDNASAVLNRRRSPNAQAAPLRRQRVGN